MSFSRPAYSNFPRGNRTIGCGNIDMQEIQKREIYNQQLESDPSFNFGGFSQPVMDYRNVGEKTTKSARGFSERNYGYEEYNYYFDSDNRSGQSELDSGEIVWNISNLDSNRDISDCVQIEIGEFYLPQVYTGDSSPDFFYYQRAFMEITSTRSAQAIVGFNNKRFHFEFEIKNSTGQAVLFCPIRSKFTFRKPIQSMTEFSVVFSVPPNFKKIPIPNSEVGAEVLIDPGSGTAYNPIRLKIESAYNTPDVLAPVGSTDPIAIIVKGYSGNSVTINNKISNPEGIFITRIIDQTTFEIGDIDGSAQTIGNSCRIDILKNRFGFPVKFTTLAKKPTNYAMLTI